MPDGVYDMDVTGDKTIVFRIGDPSNPKEVTTFANVNLISYLIPDDFTKGRKNLKIEAEKDHVVLYTGDKETAILRYSAYSIFKELMAGAEIVYGQRALVTDGGGTYEIKETSENEFAYITAPISNVDISADINVRSLTGTVDFFIGSVTKTAEGDIDAVTKTLSIEMDSAGNAIIFNKLGELLTPNPGSTNSFNQNEAYNLKIKRLSYDDCYPTLCPSGIAGEYYYVLAVYNSDNTLRASAYISEPAIEAAPEHPLDNWFFGDASSANSFTDSIISSINPATITVDASNYRVSSSTTKEITTSIKMTYLDLTSNSVSFMIDTGELDKTKTPPEEITIPISFHSYYPLTDVLYLLKDYSDPESCFRFSLEPGTGAVNIEKC
ncbi:MAG: hypothetical protein NT001_01110 [Candidatus Woesearchaeota archaeon]|nr:hypothetical protein [Candidatus Woesearchaeota archaeon]